MRAAQSRASVDERTDAALKKWDSFWPKVKAMAPDKQAVIIEGAELLLDANASRLTEKKIARYARRCARIVIARRKAGDSEDAKLIETAAMTFVDMARAAARGAA